MTDLTKRTSPEVGLDATSAQRCRFVPELQAGVSLAKGDACYVDSNSRAQKAVSTVIGATGSHLAESKFDGIVAEDFISGSFGVTLYGAGAIVGYAASGLTVGAHYYVSNTAGKIQDAMQGATDRPIAKAISATDILILR